jgi:hypothetical protein
MDDYNKISIINENGSWWISFVVIGGEKWHIINVTIHGQIFFKHLNTLIKTN